MPDKRQGWTDNPLGDEDERILDEIWTEIAAAGGIDKWQPSTSNEALPDSAEDKK